MDRDIVLVTFNYRLGAFGFLAMGTVEVPGNVGMKDQIMALRWIQRNIAKFGGDKSKVTIFGYSAGAFAVTSHLVSPMSAGLFHRVIAMSGSITTATALKHDYKELAIKLASKVNCQGGNNRWNDMMDCLRKVSW
jgi:carboxylesterase type B